MIDKYVLEAFESTSFTELTRNSLQMVMRRDTLEVEELDVFNTCIRWAEAECQRLQLEVNNVLYSQLESGFTRTKDSSRSRIWSRGSKKKIPRFCPYTEQESGKI